MSQQLAKTILEQIVAGRGADGNVGAVCMLAWGARDFGWTPSSDQYEVVLSFAVSGLLHQGFVRVGLTYLDTYTIQLAVTRDGPAVRTVEMVYCDTLCTTIDQLVEHSGSAEAYRRRLAVLMAVGRRVQAAEGKEGTTWH